MAQRMAGPVDDPAWRWTVDGVSPEAQKAAEEAAEREKLPLGAWTEAAIMRAAEHGRDTDAPAEPVAEDPRPSRRYF
ncbi:MAG TPA: hypothetical protein VLR47_05135 [Rhodospirillales bacterium]|nr:hypothetical protein [Rhodospirillales bacterium]